ncbi:MAG: hypothetical protein AAGN35_21360 [Bacteroidota bacterium]
MDNPPPAEPPQPGLPPEVKLLKDIVASDWYRYFGHPPTRSGPFPAYNWTEDYPPAMREASGYSGPPVDWMEGIAQAPAPQRPELMDGCRKAPIMALGLNPHAGTRQSDFGVTSPAYPQFRDADGNLQFNRYAYYSRYKTFYEAVFERGFTEENLAPESAFRAEKSGWVLSAERRGTADGTHDRIVDIKILYDNDDHTRNLSFRVPSDQHFALLFEPMPTIVPTDTPQFGAGAVIGGILEITEPKATRLQRTLSGYHERMVPILETLTYLAGTQLRGSQLALGEDVSQVDLLDLDTPGWGPALTDSAEDRSPVVPHLGLSRKERALWVQQLLISRPVVLMVVGRSALEVVVECLGRHLPEAFRAQFLTGDQELVPEADGFDFMKACCEAELFLEIREHIGSGDARREYHLRCRLLVLPDFAEPANYMPQVRFPVSLGGDSTINEWENFCAQFPEAGQLLESGQPLYPVVLPRVHPDPAGGKVNVWLMGEEDPIQTMLKNDAWATLIDSPWYYDPTRQIAQALLAELDEGRLAYDSDTGHLVRAEGRCRFCVNRLWKFPPGCTYTRVPGPKMTIDFLEAVVEAVLWR